MPQISLIANTGIQFHKTKVSFNWNDIRSRFFFCQSYNKNQGRVILQAAHHLTDPTTGNDIYLSKNDLKVRDMLNANDDFVGPWNGNADITRFPAANIIQAGSSFLTKSILPRDPAVLCKFFDQWLPFPCFEKNLANQLQDGPYNWVKVMVSPCDPDNYSLQGPQQWNVSLAFDTTSIFDNGNYNNVFREQPLFPNLYERTKTFGTPVSDLSLLNFVAPPNGNRDWIDSGILKLVHNTTDLNNLFRLWPQQNNGDGNGGGATLPPLFSYLVAYLYFIHIIASQLQLDVSLVNAENSPSVDVNLVVDMGNSKTTAVLFEQGHFDKVAMLELQDFSRPFQSEKSPFDMNVVFDRADFGICKIINSTQFLYPSLVRLGREATHLRYQAGFNGAQKLSSCSSPKRYLWDKHPSSFEWQNIPHGNADPEPIELAGITSQFSSDGSLSTSGLAGGAAHYSRRSLMTFAFLEILSQAFRQINSQEFRNAMGQFDSPRRIAKIIVTCPTAMSRFEQIELRTAAAEAYTVLNRFLTHSYGAPLQYAQAINMAPVIPSISDLRQQGQGQARHWSYDEATCVQFVYLCAEVVERYQNNCDIFFQRYGKCRPGFFESDGHTPYNRESLTVASVDIGAGTTDVMVCSYKYDTVGQTTLSPIPHYWESFYIAGDDLLKAFVQNIVIEGPNAMVENKLRGQGLSLPQIRQRITDFFGIDTARMDFHSRQIRREFCQQISIPIAQYFMECLRQNRPPSDVSWSDVFDGHNKPNEQLLVEFQNHFNFPIQDQVWRFDPDVASQIVCNVLDDLIKKISLVLSKYDCDVVILAGRPCSLKPIQDLFLKYYPVHPNRLKVLNDYRVGRWYPFQDGNGFFSDQKSVVAVGALVGYICSDLGGFNGLSFKLSDLGEKMLPTTQFIGVMPNAASSLISNNDILLSPNQNSLTFDVPAIPIRLGCRQLDSESYPARPFFSLDFDDYAIRNMIIFDWTQRNLPTDNEADIQNAVSLRKLQVRRNMPISIEVDRDYIDDRERVDVISVSDANGNNIPKAFLSLQVKSLSESDSFWIDNGEFRCMIAAHN